jgi:hypothetical protein
LLDLSLLTNFVFKIFKEKNETRTEQALNIPNKSNEPIYGNNNSNTYKRIIFKINNLVEDNPYLLRVYLVRR